jgi:hypothetical protein
MSPILLSSKIATFNKMKIMLDFYASSRNLVPPDKCTVPQDNGFAGNAAQQIHMNSVLPAMPLKYSTCGLE